MSVWCFIDDKGRSQAWSYFGLHSKLQGEVDKGAFTISFKFKVLPGVMQVESEGELRFSSSSPDHTPLSPAVPRVGRSQRPAWQEAPLIAKVAVFRVRTVAVKESQGRRYRCPLFFAEVNVSLSSWGPCCSRHLSRPLLCSHWLMTFRWLIRQKQGNRGAQAAGLCPLPALGMAGTSPGGQAVCPVLMGLW